MGSRNSRHSDTRVPRSPREKRAPYRLPAQDAADAKARRSSGGEAFRYEVIRTSADVTAESGQSITGDATSGDLDITLTSSPVSGKPIVVKKKDSSSNVVNIVASIEGATKIALSSQYDFRVVMYDGDAWYVIGSN